MTEHNEQVSTLLQNIQQGLSKQGFLQSDAPVMPTSAPAAVAPASTSAESTFNQNVEAIRTAHLDSKMDGEKGQAEGHYKRALAGNKQADIVEVARRIARTLSVHGVVSIDDVTAELRKLGYESSADVDPEKRRHWKGSVFATSEWIAVGKIPSRITANHGRPVRLWVSKVWLQKNSLNGTALEGSRFNAAGIRSDFERAHPGIQMQDCNWFVGTGRLSAQTQSEIEAGQMTLYGAPVTLIQDAVGAMLQLPAGHAPAQIPGVEPVSEPTTLTSEV